MEKKKCNKCGDKKSFSEFHQDKSAKDGLTSICKMCKGIYHRNYRHTKEGLSKEIYNHQKSKSRLKGWVMPTYTLKELRYWLFAQDWFHVLFTRWEKSGFKKMLSPSCDRLDDYKPYTLDNLQITTWQKNKDKGHADCKNGINNKRNKAVIGVHKDTGKIIKFHSVIEAQRQTGIANSSISDCCSGKIKKHSNSGYYYMPQSAGGYVWKYDIKHERTLY